MLRKISAFFMVLTLLVVFAGCTASDPEIVEPETETPPQTEAEVSDPEAPATPIEEPEEPEMTITATLYLVNGEYVATGDEDLDKVVSVEREIVKNPDRAEEELIIEQLGIVPTEVGMTTALADIVILSVTRDGGVLVIDLAPEGLSGGSLSETLVLNQLVRTGAALEGIEAVQITVGGGIQETLMGHITIDQPLAPSDLDW